MTEIEPKVQKFQVTGQDEQQMIAKAKLQAQQFWHLSQEDTLALVAEINGTVRENRGRHMFGNDLIAIVQVTYNPMPERG